MNLNTYGLVMSDNNTDFLNYSSLSDEKLLEAYQEGKTKAFNEFYKRRHQLIQAYIMSKVREPSISLDIFQQVFMKIHTNIHRFDTTKKAMPWVFTVTRNCIIDHFRKEKKYLLIDYNVKVEELSTDKEAQEVEYEYLLDGLSPEDKNLIIERYFGEKSFEELSKENNNNETNIRKRISRIMAKIRKQVKKTN